MCAGVPAPSWQGGLKPPPVASPGSSADCGIEPYQPIAAARPFAMRREGIVRHDQFMTWTLAAAASDHPRV